MNEEKSMAEYKEQRGIFQWLKSKFQKLKEKFRPKRIMQEGKRESQEGQELSEEELDKGRGGIPLSAVDMEELMGDLGIEEPKSWELTKEQQRNVEEGYNEIRTSNNQTEQDLENGELSEEDLDKVMGGPYGIEPRYDYPKNTTSSNDKFVGR